MGKRLEYQTLVPAGMRALGGVHLYVAKSGLPASLVDLVYLRVSLVNGCAYCIDQHSRDLRKHGMAVEKVMLVSAWREAGTVFSEEERAAMAWADTVTRVAETAIPDADYAAAAAHFEPRALADLTIAIGLMNTYNRIAIAFRQEPDLTVPPPG